MEEGENGMLAFQHFCLFSRLFFVRSVAFAKGISF